MKSKMYFYYTIAIIFIAPVSLIAVYAFIKSIMFIALIPLFLFLGVKFGKKGNEIYKQLQS